MAAGLPQRVAGVRAGRVAGVPRAVLQFHLGLLLLAVAFVAAFGRGRRLFLAAVPPVLFTLVPAWWACLRGTPPARPSPSAFRVMTCNLLMVNRDTGPIIAEILAARPDVLLLRSTRPSGTRR